MFIDMDNLQENVKILIGAKVDPKFAEKFREYCRANDFKQRTLFRRLVEWWLALDPIDQEHLYRGRLQELNLQVEVEKRSNALRKAQVRQKEELVRAKSTRPGRKAKPSKSQ